jgi:hypothetical protein
MSSAASTRVSRKKIAGKSLAARNPRPTASRRALEATWADAPAS